MLNKFEIFRDIKGHYRWRLVARNNEIVAASEGYTTKNAAIISCQAVRRIAGTAMVYDRTILEFVK